MMKNSAYYREQARGFLGTTWKPYALAMLIYMAITLGVSATGIGSIASLIIAGPFALALSIMSLKAIKGQGVEVMNIFSGFENFVNALILCLYQGLIIFLWSLLLIVPGILKSLSYSMTFYILAENPDMKAKQAMEESKSLMEGHRWEYFKLQFSFIGWLILSVFTFGILILWVSPYMDIATAAFYEDLKIQKYGIANPYNSNFDNTEQPTVQQNNADIDTMFQYIQQPVQPSQPTPSAEPTEPLNQPNNNDFNF